MERRSITIGIVGTIVIHLLLLWMAPRIEQHFMSGATAIAGTSDNSGQSFEIEIAPDEFVEPPPPPQQFVEVNPDAPDNPPDETDQFGARNQQLAQEVPDPENREEMPTTEGEEEIDSSAIVSGMRSPPLEVVEAPPPMPENEAEESEASEPVEAAPLAQDPLAGEEELEAESDEGIGSNIVRLPENPQPDVTERVEGERDPAQARPDAQGRYYRPDPSRPQPRPQISQQQVRPTIMAARTGGTDRMGVRAHNALRTTYGEYLARVIDVVDAEWNRAILDRYQRRFSMPISGSKVEVTFVLDKEGKVTISKVDGDAGQMWDSVAVEAIAAPARYSEGYGKWADDMIAVLGDRQELVFTFFY